MRKLVTLILVLMAGISSAAAPEPVNVIAAEFGLFVAGTSGELILEPALVVPRKVGQRYGWIIELHTARRVVSVREEYLLPAPAQTATDPLSESLNIPLERRNQVSQRQLVPAGGRIYGEWTVGPAEPLGHRHLQVVIEGQVAASFEFDVQ